MGEINNENRRRNRNRRVGNKENKIEKYSKEDIKLYGV
jgi:hypothetical protein